VVPVDFVLLCLGYEMEMSLFNQIGVTLQGDEQIPQYNPDTMETNVPHVYVAGTAAGGMERRRELFIATSHEHVEKIARALTGQVPGETGSPKSRRYDIELKDVQED
jgi:thioredoxin reductase (NADPH)